MKKKVLSKRLQLNKTIISSLQASKIKGGGTRDCSPDETRDCPPPPSVVNCGGNWTGIKTQ